MTIAKKVEEFERLYSCEYRWVKDRINQPDAVDYLTNLLQQVEEEAKKEVFKKLEKMVKKEIAWCKKQKDSRIAVVPQACFEDVLQMIDSLKS